MEKKNRWQRAYDFFRGWRAPKCLKALIKVSWLILKRFPHITKVAMQAYEMSKFVENETMDGLLKKGKVVEKIKEVAKTLNLELPATVINVISELAALAVKFLAQ